MRLLALILAGCTWGGGLGLDLPVFDLVYECRGAVTVEHCYDGDPRDIEEALGVTCEPTSRHLGPCLWCCGNNCSARGSNALNGSWCGEGE